MPGPSPNWLRRLAILLPAVIAFVLIGWWVLKTYLATRAGDRITFYYMTLAAALDPTEETYQLGLGRFYQYNPANMNPDQAMVHIKRAVELSPYDPQAWLDLGAALEFQGNTDQAEVCLRRADVLAPNLPPIQWTIANFFLLHGNIDEAFKHFKVVLKGSNQYDRAVFDTAWKASGDANKILNELVPAYAQTEFAYLDYVVSHRNFEAAAGVWKRLVDSPETFPPGMVKMYLDGLINDYRAPEASRVWNDLLTKGLVPSTDAPSKRNLIVNGDFEEPPLNVGFDWRLIPLEGSYAGLDQTTFHSPSHSLLIQFMGTDNLNFQNAMEFVSVEPNHRYRLQAFMRTEGITTDSGPRLQLRDVYDTRVLDLFSEELTGDNAWTELKLDFKTPAKTDVVAVVITRLPSQKLDNKIAGKVWVDDVTLTALP